jgi:hypothetical protein
MHRSHVGIINTSHWLGSSIKRNHVSPFKINILDIQNIDSQMDWILIPDLLLNRLGPQ